MQSDQLDSSDYLRYALSHLRSLLCLRVVTLLEISPQFLGGLQKVSAF